jgi:hypothetical protein
MLLIVGVALEGAVGKGNFVHRRTQDYPTEPLWRPIASSEEPHQERESVEGAGTWMPAPTATCQAERRRSKKDR